MNEMGNSRNKDKVFKQVQDLYKRGRRLYGEKEYQLAKCLHGKKGGVEVDVVRKQGD